MAEHHTPIGVFRDRDTLTDQRLGNIIRFKQKKAFVVLDRQCGRDRPFLAPDEHIA